MPNDIEPKGAAKAKAEKLKNDGKPKADKGKVEKTGDGFFTKLSRFVRESYIEVVKKAAWPTWPELKKFTTVVIIAVVFVGLYIGLLDAGLGKLTDPLLKAGNK